MGGPWSFGTKHEQLARSVQVAYGTCYYVIYEPLLVERTHIKVAIQNYLRYMQFGNFSTTATPQDKGIVFEAARAWAKRINDQMDEIVLEANKLLGEMIIARWRAADLDVELDDEMYGRQGVGDLNEELDDSDSDDFLEKLPQMRELKQLSVEARDRLIQFRDAAYIERVKEVAHPFIATEKKAGGEEEEQNGRKRKKMDENGEKGDEEEDDGY